MLSEDEMLADLEMGKLNQEEEPVFEVDDDTYYALVLFQAMASQWNTENGIRKGLKYEVIPAVKESMGIDMNPKSFYMLRIAENVVMCADQEKRVIEKERKVASYDRA